MQARDTEKHIQRVGNFQDFVATEFCGDVNAICWDRKLEGNFAEIVDQVELEGEIMVLDPAMLNSLELSKHGQVAREVLLRDLELLTAHGASPTLNIIKSYERDDIFPFFPTDVYSYHVDSSPVPSDTILCTYHGDASDILPNAQARKKVLIPEIRIELRKLYDEGEEGFEAFLSEHFFDLHYQALPDAQPINLGIGHFWRLAIEHPGSEVLPCIHRAPEEKSGMKRLLMIC